MEGYYFWEVAKREKLQFMEGGLVRYLKIKQNEEHRACDAVAFDFLKKQTIYNHCFWKKLMLWQKIQINVDILTAKYTVSAKAKMSAFGKEE